VSELELDLPQGATVADLIGPPGGGGISGVGHLRAPSVNVAVNRAYHRHADPPARLATRSPAFHRSRRIAALTLPQARGSPPAEGCVRRAMKRFWRLHAMYCRLTRSPRAGGAGRSARL